MKKKQVIGIELVTFLLAGIALFSGYKMFSNILVALLLPIYVLLPFHYTNAASSYSEKVITHCKNEWRNVGFLSGFLISGALSLLGQSSLSSLFFVLAFVSLFYPKKKIADLNEVNQK